MDSYRLTIYRSRGSSSLRIVRTASTTISVSWSARSWYSFVLRDVRATHSRISLSVASILSLNVSRNCRVAFFAVSKPYKAFCHLACDLRTLRFQCYADDVLRSQELQDACQQASSKQLYRHANAICVRLCAPSCWFSEPA